MTADLQIGDQARVTQITEGVVTDIRNGFIYIGGDDDSIDAAVFRLGDPSLTIEKIGAADAAPAGPPMPDWHPGDLIRIKDHVMLRTDRNTWACTGANCVNGHDDSAVSYDWGAGNVTIILKNDPPEDPPQTLELAVEDPPTNPIPTIPAGGRTIVHTLPTAVLPELSGWVR